MKDWIKSKPTLAHPIPTPRALLGEAMALQNPTLLTRQGASHGQQGEYEYKYIPTRKKCASGIKKRRNGEERTGAGDGNEEKMATVYEGHTQPHWHSGFFDTFVL